MNLRVAIILVFLAMLSLYGCDKNPLGTVESQGHPPFVSSVRLTPSTVRIDTIAPVNGLYHLKMNLSAQVTDADGLGNLRSVLADIVAPSGDHLQNVILIDNGSAPDSTNGGKTFSAQVDLPISKNMVGSYYPYVTAYDQGGLTSNRVSVPLLVYRQQNFPPRIYNLSAPDTVHVQMGSSVNIPMRISAADSDGQADIKEVYFLSLDSSDPTTHFQLLDDGGETNNGLSGDQVAGDGIYSIVIKLTRSTSTKPLYRFQFQARDAAGDTSASLLHSVTITDP